MDWDLKYGKLAEDVQLIDTCENLKERMQEVQQVLDQLMPLKEQYDKMTLPAQIDLDLFLAFALNSLQWINLRIQGEDPMTHPVREELLRIKTAMMKWQQSKDRAKRPKVDVEAAKRFIKSGLYDRYRGTDQPLNKKIKFPENEE